MRLLVVVRDLNLVGISRLPSEANPILIVDPYAVLPAPVAAQPFESIPPRNTELAEVSDSIDLIELPTGDLPHVLGTGSSGNRTPDSIKDVLGPAAPEGAYHGLYYNDTRDNLQSLSESAHRGAEREQAEA